MQVTLRLLAVFSTLWLIGLPVTQALGSQKFEPTREVFTGGQKALAAVPTARCPPTGVKVLATSGPLSVYTSLSQQGAIRACRGQGPSVVVGAVACGEDTCSDDRLLAATGTCVAVEEHEVEDRTPPPDLWHLRVFDVRLRRSWSYPLGIVPLEDSRQRGPGAIGPVSAVVLGPGCAVSWINSLAAGSASEVRTSDKSGRFLRARGTDIDPLSLKRTGTTVTWIQGGLPRSAPLSGAPPWRRRAG